MRGHRLLLTTIAIILVTIIPLPFVTHSTAAATRQCFAETGHCIQAGFLVYWQANGGLARFGYPLSDEGLETLADGRPYTVQYFERVRLEYHPENPPPYDILLGQFGRDLHPADSPAPPREGAVYFAATGHNLGAGFLAYWQANGGLAQFGYPLSEEISEPLADGQTYTVQYFERARFEYHPENHPPYDVLLGQFGRRFFAASFLAPFPGQPPACQAADLAGDTTYGAGAGTFIGSIILTNVSGSACTLSGTPQLTFVDDAGHDQAVPLPAPCPGGTDTCPAQWAIAAPPGGRVASVWILRNYCRLPAAPPLSFRVILPGDNGELIVPIHDGDGHRLTAYPKGAVLW
jgi:hypothetical protein